MQNTVRQVGGALGVAVIGTVLATKYAASLSTTLASLPPQFPEAAKNAASGSLVATVGVLNEATANGLPSEIADSVRAAAFDDFLNASHLTSFISLVVVIIAALIVGILLPHITPLTRKIEESTGTVTSNPTDAIEVAQAEQYREQAESEYLPRGKVMDQSADGMD